MIPILSSIRHQLSAQADPKWKAGAERYFKEPVKFYGLPNGAARKIGQEHYKRLPDKSKETVFAYCEELFQSGFMEETIIACNWSEKMKKHYQPEDFVRFEWWISQYVNNWAACDTLCTHTVGDFIMLYPDSISNLKEFTASSNRWMRRAAAVSLIIPASRGYFLPDIFEIARLLLQDTDDLVQKGYGWMLKAASIPHRQEVFEFVVDHKATMPRTALRYAIEKMPAEMRALAMER